MAYFMIEILKKSHGTNHETTPRIEIIQNNVKTIKTIKDIFWFLMIFLTYIEC